MSLLEHPTMSSPAPQDNIPTAKQSSPPQPETGATTPASGRTPDGRFARGNKGGPGNPYARRSAAARRAFTDTVSDEDLVEIARALTQKAKAGDIAAAKVVLAYVVGTPEPVVEPDTLNLAELKHYEEETKHFKALPAVAAAPDLEMVCTIARSTRPSIAEAASKDISHAFLTGQLPEGSPFRGPDSLECQDETDSDKPPLENGDNGLPEGSEACTLPGPEALQRGQELLEELGIATPQGQKSEVAGPAAKPQVDAQVVAVAVMMLYEAMIAANGGHNPFLALVEPPESNGNSSTPNISPAEGLPGAHRHRKETGQTGDKSGPGGRSRPA
jgi:hypothetical protein